MKQASRSNSDDVSGTRVPPLVSTLRASRSTTKPENDRRRRAGAADASPGSTQDRANPGEELARVERLAQIVVGAELEPDNAIDVVVPGGQHDNRHRAACTQTTADRKAVLSGKHDVEDHKVWFHPRMRAVDTDTILGDLDGKAFAHEKVGEQRADVAVILDEKNGFAGHVGNLDAQKTQAMPNRHTVTKRYKSTAR